MTSLVPKMFPGLGEHTMNFVNTVKAATDGRITIKLYGAGDWLGRLNRLMRHLMARWILPTLLPIIIKAKAKP